MRKMIAVPFLVGVPFLAGLMAAPAHAQAAVNQTCSNWTQITPGTWGIVCVGTATSTNGTNAWAQVFNGSGRPVHASAVVFMKDETAAHAGCDFGFGTVPINGSLNCNGGGWKWVAPPRWARARFVVETTERWVTTPVLP